MTQNSSKRGLSALLSSKDYQRHRAPLDWIIEAFFTSVLLIPKKIKMWKKKLGDFFFLIYQERQLSGKYVQILLKIYFYS